MEVDVSGKRADFYLFECSEELRVFGEVGDHPVHDFSSVLVQRDL